MVAWYGGGTRSVGIASGSGHRYKADQGFVEIAWVFVRDRTGTHRDESFSSTDPTMGPAAMVEAYAGRWNIETTFQELRCHLGLETTRGWCRRTVLRAAPGLFGLEASGAVDWPGKADMAFSDASAAVRRWLWREWGFLQAGGTAPIEELPTPLQDVLFYALAPAASPRKTCISRAWPST